MHGRLVWYSLYFNLSINMHISVRRPLCVYVCMLLFMCICICVHPYEGQRKAIVCFLGWCVLFFLREGIYWNSSELVSESQRSLWLCLPRARVTITCYHACIFVNMISGDETHIYMLEKPCLKASQTVHLKVTKFQSVGKLPKCQESRRAGSTENCALERRYNNI